jgi:hypothetical protein
MRTVIVAITVAGLLAMALASGAYAESCPPAFHDHQVGDGNHEHEPHKHVGLDMERVDLNDNSVICVKHVTPDGLIHVHIDDFLP